MIQTLNTLQVAHALLQDEYAGWSYKGAYAIAEMLEQYEDDTDTPVELDVVAIRCDYSEYPNALEYALEHTDYKTEHYQSELSEDENIELALTYLQENTMVFEFEGGIIVQQF